MHTFKIALTIALALFLQLLVSKYLGFFKYVDLALVVTAYFSLQRVPIQGMVTGLIAGLGGDAVSGGILGVGGFSKTLIGYIISIASVKLSLENPLARLAVVALASAANTLLIVGLYQMLEQSQIQEQALPFTGTWVALLRTVGWKSLADTTAALIGFTALDKLFSEHAAARRMAIKKRFYE
ncbi:MAG TPA: rod shape-determining protein MreD [Blastocatellia bacterium]|nr:rod shape-determining protein MreD [Blastocatellia bacterium]